MNASYNASFSSWSCSLIPSILLVADTLKIFAGQVLDVNGYFGKRASIYIENLVAKGLVNDNFQNEKVLHHILTASKLFRIGTSKDAYQDHVAIKGC